MQKVKYIGYGKFKGSEGGRFSALLNSRNKEAMKGARIGDEFSFDFLQKGVKISKDQQQMNRVTNLVNLSRKKK